MPVHEALLAEIYQVQSAIGQMTRNSEVMSETFVVPLVERFALRGAHLFDCRTATTCSCSQLR